MSVPPYPTIPLAFERITLEESRRRVLAFRDHVRLVTLTHTPSPMGFLGEVLGRPKHERAYVLIPVGYPAPETRVPDVRRKPLEEIRVVV